MKYDWLDIQQKMTGNWQAMLMSSYNIHPSVFNGKLQACPHCGGKDRFRFDNNMEFAGDGGAYCNQCGPASGINWVQRLGGINFYDALESCANWLNMVPVETRKPVLKPIASKNTIHSIEPDQIETIMKKFTRKTVSKWTVFNGIACDVHSDGVKMAFKMFSPEKVPAHGEPFSGTACNIAYTHRDGHVTYEAGESTESIYGRITRGAVTPIGDNKGRAIYLCVDYVDACHAHYLTNAQVWCCWTPENMEQVAWAFPEDVKSARLRAVVNIDFNELCAAENGLLKIMVPLHGKKIRYAKSLYRRLYDPSEFIEQAEAP